MPPKKMDTRRAHIDSSLFKQKVHIIVLFSPLHKSRKVDETLTASLHEISRKRFRHIQWYCAAIIIFDFSNPATFETEMDLTKRYQFPLQ